MSDPHLDWGYMTQTVKPAQVRVMFLAPMHENEEVTDLHKLQKADSTNNSRKL